MDRRLAASTDVVRFRVDATRCDGTPIPGLYAAGNITAQLFGDTAPASGATLGPGMTFGYLAGCAAAASLRPC
jgi:3-oxosteroid 1-dehydrogenase